MDTVLLAQNLYDPKHGNMSEMALRVEGDKIHSIGKPDTVNLREARVLQFDGLTVMPGLIDMHVHLSGRRSMGWMTEY